MNERNVAPAKRTPRAAVRADIQGLRAFAVLVVIANHLFHQPVGGFVGVDVFFVISGYLITAHMLRELESRGRLSFGDFYRRRARRIIPAATATIVVTIIAAAVLLPRSRAIQASVDGVWAFFFGANWRALATDTDYFQLGLPPSPFQHFWSLSVEEQFYFVWPLLAAGAFLLAVRAGRRMWIVGAAFTIVSAASFGWALFASVHDPSAAYFSTFTRAWELGIGALLAALLARPWAIPPALRIALAWAGIAGLVASVLFIPPDVVFPAPTALLPVLSAALVIAAGTGITSPGYDRALAPLTNRVSGYLGDISYSLYLWHFPFIVLLPSLLPSGEPLFVIAALALTALLSVASYHLIEQPVRHSGWLLGSRATDAGPRRRRHIPVLAGLAIAGVVAGGLTALRIADRPADPASTEAAPCFGAAAAPGIPDSCEADPLPVDDLMPAVDELSEDTAGGFFCWRGEATEMRSCTIGSEGPDALRVALVGDSHSAMLIPALRDRLDELGWSLDTYTGYGCQWRTRATGDCADVMSEVQERLEAGPAYDVVITTAARWAVTDSRTAPSEYADAWAPVAARGTRIVAVGDVPTVDEHALACLSRIGVEPADCSTDLATAMEPADPLAAAAASLDGVRYVDVTDLYCDADRCPAVIGNAIVYRDTAGHVTGTYMASAGEEITERIRAAALE